MKYRATVTLVNDDVDPSPRSVAHILAHLLRGEGVISVSVVDVPQDREDTNDESLYDALAKAVKPLPTQPLPQGGGRRDRGQSEIGARP